MLLWLAFSGQQIAQAPQGIPYQSILRNSSGNILANQNVSHSFVDYGKVLRSNLGLTGDLNYVIYAGDVSQDGFIDTGGYIDIDNDSFNYLAEYNPSDVNGDGTTDSGDYISIDNNGFNYIGLHYLSI